MGKVINVNTILSKSGSRQNGKMWRSLPPLKVPDSVKYGPDWGKNCVAAIVSMSQSRGDNGRSTRKNKRINYDMVNSRYKQSDFEHVLNPYGVDNPKYTQTATKMQNYNLVRQPLESLKGEEMKMGINFRAAAVNGRAVLEKNAERQAVIEEAIKQRIMARMDPNADPETMPDPAQAADKFNTEYANPTEIATNKLLKFLIKKDMLQMKFSKGWEHALISAEELYYVTISDGHPTVRTCNPLNVTLDREVENPFVHQSDWAMEERWMPAGTLIDEYGEYMDDDLVRRIDNGELGGTHIQTNGQSRDFAYDFNGGMRMDDGIMHNSSHIYVANTCWRAYKKIGHLRYLNPRTGTVESDTVDESFKMPAELKELGAEVTWDWITEIWEGTRIGASDYVNVKPVDNQTGNLPYVGYIYNNVNSVATSLVDMVKAHQYTYIIVWYRLEQELAKAKGRKFVMDLAQLPKSKGWTVDQWMYYFDNLGVAWINSTEEGRKGDPNSMSKFNQFQAIDMSLSNIVGQYMSILSKLEEQVERITGVSRQRAGDIQSSETATGAQRAIIQSTNNTKPLYFYHDIVKETVLNEMLELCKVAYADGIELEHIVDEETIETIKIDSGMLNGTDLGVFLTNSFEESENKEKLERFLDVALQTDKARLSDIAKILGSNSISEIRDTIVSGERAKEERDQQNLEQANASQEKMKQMELEDKQLERDFEREKYEAEIEKDIIVANIKAGTDLEKSKMQAENITGDDTRLAERKQEFDEEVKRKELTLKERALEETKRSNKEKESISKIKKQTTNGKN